MSSPPGSPSPHLSDVRFAVVDLETTGLDPERHQILQIAVVTTDASGHELDAWSTYVRPPRWPFVRLGPRHVHGITHSRLRGAPRLPEALRELVRRIDNHVITAHNAEFDLSFIRHHAGRCGIILPNVPTVCTLTLSRSLDRSSSRSHRLEDLCKRYDVRLERAHDALEDARATAQVLPHLVAESGVTTLEHLMARSTPSRRRQSARS